MKSHGIFKNLINKNHLDIVRNECLVYLSQNNQIDNYSSEISSFSENINSLLNHEIISRVCSLLKDENPILCATELHIQRAKCKPIPPHQDNFYHCIDPEKGLKILVPLQDLTVNNGGLIFLDYNNLDPVLKHSPSNIKNFSAYIDKDTFRKVNKIENSYDLKRGDSTYHFINSIHYSKGNRTNKDSLFIVYRFQCKDVLVNKNAESLYLDCYEAHLKKIN